MDHRYDQKMAGWMCIKSDEVLYAKFSHHAIIKYLQGLLKPLVEMALQAHLYCM